ncbi:MAG: hypothetical protein IK064_03550, partial [Clostridia bacterium]|nr:hypothetical protein [Clostridia bacterium]
LKKPLRTSDGSAALPLFCGFSVFRKLRIVRSNTHFIRLRAVSALRTFIPLPYKNHRSLWKNPFPYAIIPKLGPIRAEGGVNAVYI